MKNFLDHLVEVQKTYEFRIKVANIDPTESMDRLESALNAYGLESLSKPKRLPIKNGDVDFPSAKNLELFLMDAVLSYPVNDQQLRAIIAERAGYPAGSVVVVPKNHPEEIWRWNEDGSSEIHEYVKGEAVLDKPLEEVKGGKEAGKTYSEAGSLLKELNKAKVEIAGGETPAAKTTNDLPTGDASPVGSKQNKIPSAK